MGQIEEQYEKLQETVTALKESVEKEEEQAREIAEATAAVQKETAELLAQLEATRGNNRVS